MVYSEASYDESYDAGFETAYAAEVDWGPDFELYKEALIVGINRHLSGATWFKIVDQGRFGDGLIAGIKGRFNDAIWNGANGEMV